jgi:hypothetical protein
MILTRNRLISMAQAVAALVMFVTAVEAALRFAGIAYLPRTQPDAVLGMLHRPGATFWQREEGLSYVQINSEGFRDSEWPVEKPADEFRIAVLGDSYVEASQVPVEERFTELLAQNLAHEQVFAGKTVRVMNFGMAGYGTGQELLLFRDRVAKYQPDLVVLAFLTGDDLTDNCRSLRPHKQRPFFVLRDGELTLDNSFARRRSWKDTLSRAIANESRIVQLAYEARRTLRALRGWNPPATAAKTSGLPELGLEDLIYLPPQAPAWREAWEITERLLLAVDDEARATGAKLLVVTLTSAEQVHPNPEVRTAYMNRLGVNDLTYPDKRIARFCDDHGIAVLTLAPVFLNYAQTNNVYLHGFDNTQMGRGHWNQAGHRLTAEFMTKKLLELRTQHNPSAQKETSGER